MSRALDYEPPAPVPGHVEDLLKLNMGCLVLSALYAVLNFSILGLALWRGRAAGVGAVLPSLVLALALPVVFGAVWLSSGRIRQSAARRLTAERGERLLDGEVVVTGTVLERSEALGRSGSPTLRLGLGLLRASTPVPLYLLKVRFTVNGITCESRRDVGSEAWHRLAVGDPVDLAVNPRRRRAWRVLR